MARLDSLLGVLPDSGSRALATASSLDLNAPVGFAQQRQRHPIPCNYRRKHYCYYCTVCTSIHMVIQQAILVTRCFNLLLPCYESMLVLLRSSTKRYEIASSCGPTTPQSLHETGQYQASIGLLSRSGRNPDSCSFVPLCASKKAHGSLP